MDMDNWKELLTFLTQDTRLELKSKALGYVLGLTGTQDGRELIRQHKEVLQLLLDLTTDSTPQVSLDAYSALLNLSASDDIAECLIGLSVVPRFLDSLIDPKWKHADKICMLLSNLTRQESGAAAFIKSVSSLPYGQSSLYTLVDIFDRRDYNKDADFHHLAMIFSNITQVSPARKLFLDRSKCILPRLLPYTQFKGSPIRRSGVASLLRNLCFEVGSHEWLLGEEVDLLPALLLPLAGPEQFDDEEEEKLPVELQFLPDDKQREEDPVIRKMLIEALIKLCSTKPGRLYLREKQVYLIARELHKCEEDPAVSATCENLIQMLIADEPEPGMENLHEVQLPEGFAEKLGKSGKELEPQSNGR